MIVSNIKIEQKDFLKVVEFNVTMLDIDDMDTKVIDRDEVARLLGLSIFESIDVFKSEQKNSRL